MNRVQRIAATLAALLIATVLSACGTAPTAPPYQAPQNQEIQSTKREEAFVTIDINPSVELTLGTDRAVTSILAVGDDAAILLWQEELLGLDVEAAVAKITRLALELGYLTEENATVSITITTDGGVTQEQLFEDIDRTIEQTGADAGVTVRVEEGVDLVLSHELERVRKENADKSGYDSSLTLARYRLVKAAMDADPSLTMDAAVLLSNDKLTDRVGEARSTAEEVLDRAALLAQDEAYFAYENAKQTMLDSAYTAVYAARRDLSSLLNNRGATYAACRLAHRTVSHYADTMQALVEDPMLDGEDIRQLAEILQIDADAYEAFRQAITDEEGRVTRRSVEGYLNKLYKNMDEDDRAVLDAAYVQVLALFDRLGAEASLIKEDGRLLISGALFGLGISMEVKTYEDLPALLAAIEKKTNDVYARMEEDLTENEKAEVAEMQAEMSEKLSELEADYQESMEEARMRADERLAKEKSERIPAGPGE